MNKTSLFKNIATAIAVFFLLFSGYGCHHDEVEDILNNGGYQPVEEFAAAYDAITRQEQAQSDAPYDIEQTIRVINAMELAQMNSNNFDEFLDYMAKQDFTGVAPDVLEAKRALFPLMEFTYKLQKADEELSDSWMLMRSLARGGETLSQNVSLSELMLIMNGDLIGLFSIVASGDTEKAVDDAFSQYEKDKHLKSQLRKDLQRLRVSYRNYLEYYVPIYKKYMDEYEHELMNSKIMPFVLRKTVPTSTSTEAVPTTP